MDQPGLAKIALVVLASALALASCGKDEDAATDRIEIGADFEPYVARFQTASAQYGERVAISSLVIQFGATRGTTERGACEIGGGAPPTIIVGQAAWDRISDAEREEFLFHELGHCVLRRKHKSGIDGSGNPVSIMHPYSMDGMTYRTHQAAYLTELFQSRGEF
jgi:hypothetical protein